MGLGSFVRAGATAASPSIKKALTKAMAFGRQRIQAPASVTKTTDAIRKADARLTDRVVSRITTTPSIVSQRGASIKAKVAATDAARAANYSKARRIVNTGYGVAGAGTLGTIAAVSKVGTSSRSNPSIRRRRVRFVGKIKTH